MHYMQTNVILNSLQICPEPLHIMGTKGNSTAGSIVSFSTTPKSELVILIGISIILPIGLVGNILSIIIMNRKKFRTNTASIFLSTLAVSDSGYLLTNYLTSVWIGSVTNMPRIPDHSDWVCKVVSYTVYVTKAYGSWILVAVNLERLLSVLYPYQIKRYLTLRRARLVNGAVFVIMLLVYSYILVLQGIQDHNKEPGCAMPDRSIATIQALNIFDMVFYSLLPCTCILTSNALLYYILRYRNNSKALDNDRLGISMILLVISMTYTVLTLPLSFLLVWNAHAFPLESSELLFTCLYTMDVLNSAINFILYCISGSIFRNELKKMIFQHDVCSCRGSAVWPSPVYTVQVQEHASGRLGEHLDS